MDSLQRYSPLLQKALILLLFAFLYATDVYSQGIIVNEISQGAPGGKKEYVELVVVGDPCTTVDIREWIIDDNNGLFTDCPGDDNGALSGTGIATGYIRFKDDPIWSDVPVGTIILVYANNPSQPDQQADIGGLADDYDDADCDFLRVVPINSTNTYMEQNSDSPSSSNGGGDNTACPNGVNGSPFYNTGTAVFTAISNDGFSGKIEFRNGGDACQVRTDDGTYFHGFAYGTSGGGSPALIGGPDNILLTGGGNNTAYFFDNSVDDDYTNSSNFSSVTATPSGQTPGRANSCANAEWIESLRTAPDDEFQGAGCPNLGLLTSLCEGEQTTFSLTGCDSDAYIWSINNGNAVIVGDADQKSVTIEGVTDGSAILSVIATNTYSDIFTGLSGCSAIAQPDVYSFPLTINPVPVVDIEANVQANGDFLDLCEGETTFLDAFTSGNPPYTYNWSTGSSSNGIGLTGLSPGEHTYTVTVTNGFNCSATDDATVTMSALPTFSTPTIDACESTHGTGIALGVDLTAYDDQINNNPDTFIDWYNGDFVTFTFIADPSNVDLPPSNNALSVDIENSVTGCVSLALIPFNVLSAPDPLLTGSDFCVGESTMLEVVEDFNSYQWSTGAITQSISVSIAGIYTATITNANDCTSTATIEVNELPNLSPTVNGNDFCEGNSTTLSVAETLDSYTWSNGETTQSINVNIAGTYTVTVQDAGSCSGTAAVTVNELAALLPTLSGADFCNGQSTEVSVNENWDNYIWSTSDTEQSINVGIAGTYTVTVEDASGCTGSADITINEAAALLPTLSGSDFCNGQSTEISVNENFNTYTWSNSDTGQSINIGLAGTYTVTVEDASGCTGTSQITVNELPLAALSLSGTDFCSGQTTTLSVNESFNSYAWSNGGTNQATDVGLAGVYTVTVTESNGCTQTESISINELASPSPDATGNDFCLGTSTTLSVVQNYGNYVWSDAQVGKNVTVSAAGTYTVTVTDANNCTGTTTVTVNTLNLPNPTLSGIDFCSGGSTPLTVNESFDGYLWSTAATTQSISVNSGGVYTVTVTNSDNCTATASININEFSITQPTLSGSDFCQQIGTTLSVVENYDNYAWSNADNGQSIGINTAGVYTVTVTTTDGCTATNSIEVQSFADPNPVIDGENLCEGGMADLTVTEVFDTYAWSNGGLDQSISVAAAGIYTVTVSNSDGCTETTDFIVNALSNPDPTIEGNLNFCEGTTTNLNVVENYADYVWSTNEVSQQITVGDGGLYIVTVTDNSGCQAEVGAWVSEKPLPTATLTTNSPICLGEMATLTFELTGTAPWTLSYFNGFSNITVNVASSPYSIDIATTQNLNISLSNIEDAFCESLLFEDTEIIVNEAPTVSNIVATCNDTNTAYTLSFDLSDGDEDSYMVTGDAGNLEGNTFTSASINSGESYSFNVDDGNGCGPVLIEGSHDCNCTTFAGTMPGVPIELCTDGIINLSGNNGDEVLDGNDVLTYILHDNAGASIGTIFAENSNGSFTFSNTDPPVSVNTTYYISAVAGNDDGDGNIDLTDDCLSVSGGTPVVFLEIPSPTIEEGGSTCGMTWDLVVAPSIGTGTWTSAPPVGVTFDDPNNPTTTVTVDNTGTYHFFWTEANSVCIDVVQNQVNFVGNVLVDAGEDDEVCNDEYDLSATSEGVPGVWTSEPADGVSFDDPTNPNTLVRVGEAGVYVFTWTADNGDCVIGDEVTIIFYDGLEVTNRTHECFNGEYIVTFEIIGGNGDYLVDGSTDGLEGNVYTSEPIPSGEEYRFEMTDGSLCFPFILIDDHDCACTTNAGAVPPNTVETCGFDGIVEVITSGSVLDDGDILVYVLDDGSNPFTVLMSSPDGQFTFDEDILEYETEYFVTAIAGEDLDGDGLPDTDDVCYDRSNATPVIFYPQPEVIVSLDCSLTQSVTAFLETSEGLTHWTFGGEWTYSTDGTGTVSFADVNNPETTATASESGEYTFYWSGENGCADSVISSAIQPLTASWTAECFPEASLYFVTLSIEGGSLPYTINGTQLDPFDETATEGVVGVTIGEDFSYVIDDASLCESIEIAGTWDCDCPSPDDPTPDNAVMTYCNGGTIPQLSVADNGTDTYFWYNDPSDPTSIFEGSTFTPSMGGSATYWVQAVSPDDCVSNFVSIDLIEHPNPDNPVGENVRYCEGAIVPDLSVADNGIDTYFWYADTTAAAIFEGNTLTPPSNGTATYWVQALSPDDCRSEFVAIEVVANAIPDNPVGENESYCEGDAMPDLSVVDNGIDTYFWYADTTAAAIFEGNILTPPSMGTATYWVQAVSPDDCSSGFVAIEVVENPSPDNPVGENESYCEGDAVPDLNVIDNGVDSYFWYADTTAAAIFEGNTLTPPSSGTATYWVQALSSDDCISLFVPVNLTENEVPPTPIVSDATICLSTLLSPPIAASTLDGVLHWSADTGASGEGSFDGSGFAVGEHTIELYEESIGGCISPTASFVLTVEDCDQVCPTVTSPAVVDFRNCGEADRSLEITFNDPDNTLERIEWVLDGTVVATDVTSVAVSENPTGCDPIVLQYTALIYCSLNPDTPISAGIFDLTFYPVADAGIVILDGGCTVQAQPTCPNFSIVGDDTATTDVNGDTSEVTFTVQNDDTALGENCSAEITANFDCIITECPTISSISAGNSACIEEMFALSASVNDPNGKLDRIEWLDESGAIISTDLDFNWSENFLGCDAQIFTYTLQVYCDDDPATPMASNQVEWMVYPRPENIVGVAECSLEVVEADCGASMTILYSDDSGGTWQNTPNPTPINGETWLWQAFVTGAPDGCNVSGQVTALCDCTPPQIPIAVSSQLFEICEAEVIPTFEVMLSDGDFVQWYDAATGGTAMGQGFTFTPIEGGIYYAEVGNDADDCVSERLAFELIVNPLDDAGFGYASTDYCLGDTSSPLPDFVNTSGGTFSADNGLVIDPTTGAFDLSSIGDVGTFNITYTTPAPCSNSMSVEIAVGNNELILDAGDDIEVCETETISLNATLDGIADLQWSVGGDLGDFSDPLSLLSDFTSPNTGQFTLYLTASNDCGEDVQDSLQLTVLPSISLEIEGNRNILVGETSSLEAMGDEENMEYIWFSDEGVESLSCTDCPNPVASPNTTTTYFVTSNAACADTASITITVSEIETLRLAVQNAFSPNGDGINDEFFASVNGRLVSFHIMIFNRWGDKVFESDDINQGWNGIHNGEPQPIGVYAFVIHYQFEGQNTKQLAHNVTIIR